MDKNDKALLSSYEKGEWKSVKGSKSQKRKYFDYAKLTFKKDRRLNIRISSRDMEGIQKIAIEEGIPYQTLVSSLIHKYVKSRMLQAS